MNNKSFCFFIIVLTLLFAACGDFSSDYDTFEYNLSGTWVSNEPRYGDQGALVITIDRITIYGSYYWFDSPFYGFTKGISLRGYSEEGHIFIEDGGLLQQGIPYTYWDEYPPPDYKRIQFIRFNFGVPPLTLQKQEMP